MFDVSLAEVSKALAGVIALTGATVTIRNYRKSVQTKRAEWLSSLHDRKLKQISDDEMIALFQYDLDMISQQEFIVNAVNCQGFERLALLIESRRHN